MDSQTFQSIFVKQILLFILSLYNDSSITRNLVVFIIQFMENFICKTLIPNIIIEIKKNLNDKIDKTVIYEIELILKRFMLIFENVNTEHKIIKFLAVKGLYITGI